MSGTRFVPFEPDQGFLLPPNPREWLPESHLAYFVLDVVKQFDLRQFYKDYDGSEGGRPPFDPQMMVGLIIYAYCTGVFSSRKIERATYESVAFRVVSADAHPDHDTIAAFRKRHLKRLGKLFKKVLRLCQQAGLVKLGNVALDGTKLQANASRHKAMSWGRILKTEGELEQEVKGLLARAEGVDREEGRQADGEDLPEELKRRQGRLERLREAKAALEQRAMDRQKEEGKRKAPAAGGGQEKQGKPKEKEQYNFTDPDSRIMLDKATNSFEQSYNCQIAVDGKLQVIVAAEVTNEPNDKRQLAPMVAQIQEEVGELPKRVIADNGYCSDEQLAAVPGRVDAYVATQSERAVYKDRGIAERGKVPADATREGRMARKLRTKRGRSIYAKRKGIVEPVFGQIKHARGFRQFLLRGLENVTQEWKLICATHNLLKLFRHTWVPPAATIA